MNEKCPSWPAPFPVLTSGSRVLHTCLAGPQLFYLLGGLSPEQDREALCRGMSSVTWHLKDVPRPPGSFPHMERSLERSYQTAETTSSSALPFTADFHTQCLVQALATEHRFSGFRRNQGSETRAILPKSHSLSGEESGFKPCLMPVQGFLPCTTDLLSA